MRTDFVGNTEDLNSTIKGKEDSKYTNPIENTPRPEFGKMKGLICHQRCNLEGKKSLFKLKKVTLI